MFSKTNTCFKNIKFLRVNYQPIVPQQKHYCLIRVQSLLVVQKMRCFNSFSADLEESLDVKKYLNS